MSKRFLFMVGCSLAASAQLGNPQKGYSARSDYRVAEGRASHAAPRGATRMGSGLPTPARRIDWRESWRATAAARK